MLKEIFESTTVVAKDQRTAYTENLKKAKEFFHEKISSLCKDERDKLFQKITTRLRFDLREVDSNLDVQAVFETMNNRGKPLTVLEKLKNRLIYLAEQKCDNEIKEQLRKNINETWGIIYNDLAKNPENILDEDEFLSAHLSLYRNPADYVFSAKQTEDKIFKMFCNNSNKFLLAENDPEEYEPKVDYEKINNYVCNLAKFAPYWCKANNPVNVTLKKIYLLDGRKEIKIFIAVLMAQLDKNHLSAEFDERLKIIEKILFRNAIYGAWCLDARRFAVFARDLWALKNTDEIFDELNKACEEIPSIESVARSFRGLFEYERGNKGWHRWNGLKYLLFEYEKQLQNEFMEQDEKISIDNYASTSIEHIFPQNADCWQNELNSFISNVPLEQQGFARKIMTNTLGNLTLLRDGKNSSLGNSSWTDKKKRYSTGSLNEIEVSKYEDWNQEAIKERGEKIFLFLLQKIGITDEPSSNNVKEALFYTEKYFDLIFK